MLYDHYATETSRHLLEFLKYILCYLLPLLKQCCRHLMTKFSTDKEQVNRVSSFKYLGVELDEKWK